MGSFAPDRTVSVKLEVSPSLLWNNLAASHSRIAFAHKDNVYHMETRAIDGRAPASLEKVPLNEGVSAPVMQVSWCVISGRPLLVVATRIGVSLWASDGSAPAAAAPGGASPVKMLLHHTLAACGFTTDEAQQHHFRGIAAVPRVDTVYVGTSWGALVPIVVGGADSAAAGPPVTTGAHKHAINVLAADDKFMFSGDDAGTVVQWDLGPKTPTSIATYAAAGGVPCTSLVLRGEAAVAGYADGHIRIFRTGAGGGPRYLEVEIAAHARCITAIDMHPSQLTFASVGEDCVVNVWSLPELGAGPGGRAKVTLDLTVRCPDALLTGAQFVSTSGRSAECHLAVAAYDSHALRVFLGL